MDVLYKKPFGDKCKHVHFDGKQSCRYAGSWKVLLLNFGVCIDVHHGFAAARGNWSEGSVDRKRATEAIQLTVDYFNTYM